MQLSSVIRRLQLIFEAEGDLEVCAWPYDGQGRCDYELEDEGISVFDIKPNGCRSHLDGPTERRIVFIGD